jgi:hypothetical protein
LIVAAATSVDGDRLSKESPLLSKKMTPVVSNRRCEVTASRRKTADPAEDAFDHCLGT